MHLINISKCEKSVFVGYPLFCFQISGSAGTFSASFGAPLSFSQDQQREYTKEVKKETFPEKDIFWEKKVKNAPVDG